MLCICVRAWCLNRFKKGETGAAHATLLADDACFINRCTLRVEVRNSRIVTILYYYKSLKWCSASGYIMTTQGPEIKDLIWDYIAKTWDLKGQLLQLMLTTLPVIFFFFCSTCFLPQHKSILPDGVTLFRSFEVPPLLKSDIANYFANTFITEWISF